MPNILFYVKAPDPVWTSIYDNTKLENKTGFTWVGSYWNGLTISTGNLAELRVKTGETWDQGFRPTKVRFTWLTYLAGTSTIIGAGDWDIRGYDNVSAEIFSDPASATIGAELDITFGANDFEYFRFQYWGGDLVDIRVTNVEWYA